MPTPTLRENILIARAALNYIKSNSVCSYDIIPAHLFPTEPTEEHLRSLFGDEVTNSYLNYIDKAGGIRDFIEKLIHLSSTTDFRLTFFPIITRALVTFRFGVGQCHELATALLLHLIEEYSRFDARIATIGKETNKHAIILMGSINCPLDNITQLLTQPIDLVVIDPLLNYFGHASKYHQDNAFYLDGEQLFEFDRFSVAWTREHLPQLSLAKRQAEITFEAMHEKFTPFDRSHALIWRERAPIAGHSNNQQRASAAPARSEHNDLLNAKKETKTPSI
jgi:hypothetical protein